MTDIAKIAEGLTEGMKRAVLGFAGPFHPQSDRGGWREWWDICEQVEGRRSHHNTIEPLKKRGLAQVKDFGECDFYALTKLGLAVRAHLERER